MTERRPAPWRGTRLVDRVRSARRHAGAATSAGLLFFTVAAFAVDHLLAGPLRAVCNVVGLSAKGAVVLGGLLAVVIWFGGVSVFYAWLGPRCYLCNAVFPRSAACLERTVRTGACPRCHAELSSELLDLTWA